MMNPSTYAILAHVAVMQFAKNEMEQVRVPVSQNIMAIRIPVASQSAFSIPIVPKSKLASIINALIHVRVFAA